MMEIQRLNEDLRWCIQSPPLLKEHIYPEFLFPGDRWFSSHEVDWLEELRPPANLQRFRLGRHFEQLVGAWVQHHHDWQILKRNLQVFSADRTIGEFDLIVKSGETTEHWELAIKFYLATDSGRHLSQWYGPNPEDRFDGKYTRLTTHQLTLARQSAARATLIDSDIRIDAARGFIKGRLFYPYLKFFDASLKSPDEVNPGHEHGWWMSIQELNSRTELQNTRFAILRKIDWLSPITSAYPIETLGYTDLIHLVETGMSDYSIHVAILDEQGFETSRGFIVSQQWLDYVAQDKQRA